MTNEELVKKIQSGDKSEDYMLQLWEKNKRFVFNVVNRYRGLGELEDLEQEGYLALYDAANRYNAELGYKFLSYAEYWIKQRVVRYIKSNGTVRIPEHEIAKISGYKKMVNACQIHLGRKPSRHEIAALMHISYGKVIELEKATQMAKLRSLDSLLSMDDDSVTVGDMVPSGEDIEADVLERVQQEQLKELLWNMVDNLPEQESTVLRQRYQEDRTLKETGEIIGVTTERVRCIEARAMRDLRCSRNTRRLKQFLDDDLFKMGSARITVGQFNRTWTSATERAAIYLADIKA